MSAQGTAILDFGAFPGSAEATVDVAGQTGFVAGSLVEAFVYPVDTADHSADEHIIESLSVQAYYNVDGTFTIRGWSNLACLGLQRTATQAPWGGQPDRNFLYGQFTIGWVWN